MSTFLIEELGHRLNRLRDDQARTNVQLENRLKALEAENSGIRNRLTVLTRLLIARQIATAEEIATALAAVLAPPPAPVAAETPVAEPIAGSDSESARGVENSETSTEPPAPKSES